jgi:hypothetical protein
MDPIDVQQRIARQKGERLARGHGATEDFQPLINRLMPVLSRVSAKLLRDHRDLRASLIPDRVVIPSFKPKFRI